jgi:two-component system phosphate regulon response regulator PhoB
VGHLLLIEDSSEYQLLIRAALSDAFEVHGAINADEALVALKSRDYDIILIDVGLPGRDGLSLCEELRLDPRLRSTPILIVTGRTATADLIQGFAVGADDYIFKPFEPLELRARVEARLKRASTSIKTVDRFLKGNLVFAVSVQRVFQAGSGKERDLQLTPNEFKILYQLVTNEDHTLSRALILKEVWGENLHVVERTVDKHICSLRRKMGSTAHYVASIPGEGYMFTLTDRDSMRSLAHTRSEKVSF